MRLAGNGCGAGGEAGSGKDRYRARVIEAAYGLDHPQVAITLTNLGTARQDLGEHAIVAELLERALRIFEAAYGPDHPHSKLARNLLASQPPRRRLPDRKRRR